MPPSRRCYGGELVKNIVIGSKRDENFMNILSMISPYVVLLRSTLWRLVLRRALLRETLRRGTRRDSRYVAGPGIIVLATLVFACSPDPGDDPIPPTSFPDEVLNLNLPENIILRSKGAYRAINDIGVRGVIVYCVDVGVYHAYETNCSYRPNEACATVNVDVSTLFLTDPCCGSTFDFATGVPTGGAAWRPLRKYKTTFNGTDLIITDEVLE